MRKLLNCILTIIWGWFCSFLWGLLSRRFNRFTFIIF